MKRGAILFVTTVLAVVLSACKPTGGRVPFYLANEDALRQLPEEDLLRMRDDILKQAGRQPDREVDDVPVSGRLLRGGALTVAGGREVADGEVELLELADGSLAVVLRNFRVANAPGLELFLEKEPLTPGTAAGKTLPGVKAGSLRGNAGTQNFTLPTGTDPAQLRYAVVWCGLFRMPFAVANLESVGEAPGE